MKKPPKSTKRAVDSFDDVSATGQRPTESPLREPRETEYFDRPPPGWFVLDVMRRSMDSNWDWSALMVSVDPNDPDDLKRIQSRGGFVRIPGKHRSRNAAWDTLDAMMATRH